MSEILEPASTLRSEFLYVAVDVFRRAKRPLKPRDIVAIGIREGLFSDKRSGKTPHQTMKAKLSVHIRRYGDQSPFVRTGPGEFFLRSLLEQTQSVYHATPLSKSSFKENVLVFDIGLFNSVERFQGITREWRCFMERMRDQGFFDYMNRRMAESIFTHKQIVTYILVSRKGSVLSFTRGSYNSADKFLKGARCIGFGGHVCDTDNDLLSDGVMGIMISAKRELREELVLPLVDRRRISNDEGFSCVGAINDDSSANGQRHFAFLFSYEVSDDLYWDKPLRGEKSITHLTWLDPHSIPAGIWEFEYWSQLCLREFFPQTISAAPDFKVWRRRRLTPPNCLCVIGPIGSGKSETTKLLESEYGYHQVNSGKVLAEILALPPVPETPRETFQRAAWSFISAPGGSLRLAHAISEEVKAAGYKRTIIDGVRQHSTLLHLRAIFGERRLGVLYVHTLPDLAYAFFRQRERSNMGIIQFMGIRNSEVEQEIENLLDISDAALYNWTDILAYRQTVHNLCNYAGITRVTGEQ